MLTEDKMIRLAAFIVNCVGVACAAGVANSLILLFSGQWISAFIWFVCSVYSLCFVVIVVSLVILAQR